MQGIKPALINRKLRSKEVINWTFLSLRSLISETALNYKSFREEKISEIVPIK